MMDLQEIKELEAANTRIRKLEAKVKRLQLGIADVSDLIDESTGVAGLHLNGEDAPWSDLLKGGRYEDWLINFSIAVETKGG
ncbi:hypothetical protein CMI37_14260 [Candidatus Pacearchaeota archaeon]|nr:hypothetical protein [Candidatus Pacearchaeota archaeon]|tara:strand:- start:1263 stop:1508 length:246 start_codon:yes stop_codon:yes gene_type:complete